MSEMTSRKGLSPAAALLSRSLRSPFTYKGAVLLPRLCNNTLPVWAVPRSLATTEGIINLFSFPAGTKMFQFPAFASPNKKGDDRNRYGRVVPFGDLRVNGHLHLTAAFRSLSRPSSPP